MRWTVWGKQQVCNQNGLHRETLHQQINKQPRETKRTTRHIAVTQAFSSNTKAGGPLWD